MTFKPHLMIHRGHHTVAWWLCVCGNLQLLAFAIVANTLVTTEIADDLAYGWYGLDADDAGPFLVGWLLYLGAFGGLSWTLAHRKVFVTYSRAMQWRIAVTHLVFAGVFPLAVFAVSELILG
ncbi:MAG: hypothetical protein AAF432_08205 [Planctomycetota bacterium]